MSEQRNVAGREGELREQRAPSGADAWAGTGPSADGGTGGSEADRQEQDTPLDAAGVEAAGIAGEGTGGSEADRLEQAADVPLDAEDAFPHGAGDDGGNSFPEEDGDGPA
ncbi:hypothetical protein [Arthrobacter sp. Ld5]|uniref:hypothetical protein n=1 Tax=Arthrobacter sp. Ld5 TaxID=649152 RepID=UPI003EBFAA17